MPGVVSQVLQFTRIVVMIVQLGPFFPFVPFRVTPALGTHALSHEPLLPGAASDLRNSWLVPRLLGIVKQSPEARTFESGRRRQSAQLRESRIEIDQLNRARRRLAVSLP